jgi:hypothetical protein
MTPQNQTEFEVLDAKVSQLGQLQSTRREQLQKARQDLELANNKLRDEQHLLAEGKDANPHKAQIAVDQIRHVVVGLESLMAQTSTEIGSLEPRRRALSIELVKHQHQQNLVRLVGLRDEAKERVADADGAAQAALLALERTGREIRAASDKHEETLRSMGA